MTGELTRYLAAAAAAFLLAILLQLTGNSAFARVLGPLPGFVAVALAAALGMAALWAIGRQWTTAGPRFSEIAVVFTLGGAFALPMIGLDLARPFAPDINVPLPAALAFYPAIALVAETAFHLAPLALFLAILPRRTPVWPTLFAVACIEPAYQVAFGDGAPRDAVMAAWLVVFGVFQLRAFRRHGIAALIAARLGYYLVWHILWGAARLPLLFGPA